MLAGSICTAGFLWPSTAGGANVTLCRSNASLPGETINAGTAYAYEFAYGGPMASGTFDQNLNDNSSIGLVEEVGEVPSTDAYIGLYNSSGANQSDVGGWVEYLYTCS